MVPADKFRDEVVAMLQRWASYLAAPHQPAPTREIAREQKRARRLLSEEQFVRMQRRCRLRELPLPAILPDVENIAIPLSAINEET